MSLPPDAALWFLVAAIPLGMATVWTDLSRMKIPNWITDALLLSFIPLGLIALPWVDMLWQLVNPLVMLALGIVLHIARLMGGGDVKFLIAASPYVMVNDIWFVFFLLSLFMLTAFLIHRTARSTFGPRWAPDWQSWKEDKRFPLGFALGPTLIAYLALAAFA